MKIKKVVATLTVATVLFSSQLAHLWASPSSVGTINNGNKQYAPISTIVTQMGGQVQFNEADKTTTYTINGKKVIIDDKLSFAQIDGTYVPYETKTIGDWTIPVFRTPVSNGGNTYVPVDFLVSKVGLKLDVKDNQVAFEAVGDNNSTSTVATVNVPSTGGSQSSSNSGSTKSTGVVESNRPVSNPTKPSSGGNSNSGGTTTPSSGSGSGTTQPTKSPTYTGSDVKQKLYGLGFVDKNGGLTLNPYGANGGANYSQLGFTVGSGNRDMSLLIYQSSPEIDQKIKTALNWILPTKGGTLYGIIDNAGLQSQTVELDGRTVTIRVTSYGVALDFGPVK
jgi:Copper amine oxidase N-terminal domain.